MSMADGYDNRNKLARAGVTNLEIADITPPAMRYGMLNKAQLLEAVLAKAKTKADIADVLKISKPAATNLYNGSRDLAYSEGVVLSDHYDIDPNKLTEEKLIPVLRVCLRYAPKEWTDQSVEGLAQRLLYGLELLRSLPTNEPSPDAIEVAARAIADRFQHKRSDRSP